MEGYKAIVQTALPPMLIRFVVDHDDRELDYK